MYPIELITKFKNHEITRADFCRQYAAMQGFSDEVKGYADQTGIYTTYRGRTAVIKHGLLIWRENGRIESAESIKELKIKIDIAELKAAA